MVDKAFWRAALMWQIKLLSTWVNACKNTTIDPETGKKRSGKMVFLTSRN